MTRVLIATLFAASLQAQNGSVKLQTYQAPGAAGIVRDVASKLAETISVKDYGAACDGVTDDAKPLQAAINYAQNHGGKLNLVPGVCKYSKTLAITKPVTIEGPQAIASTIHAGAGLEYSGTGTAIKVQDNGANANGFIYRVYLRNFSLTSTSGASKGIEVNKAEEGEFSGLQIGQQGQAFASAIWCAHCSIWEMHDLTMSWNGTGINVTSGNGGSAKLKIHNNNIAASSTAAIFVGDCSNCSISDNWLEWFRTGIESDNSSNEAQTPGLLITGNHILTSPAFTTTPAITDARGIRFLNTPGLGTYTGTYAMIRDNLFNLNHAGQYAVEFTFLGSSTYYANVQLEHNFLWGATIAGVYTDSPPAQILSLQNDARDGYFGSPLPVATGAGSMSVVDEGFLNGVRLFNTGIQVSGASTFNGPGLFNSSVTGSSWADFQHYLTNGAVLLSADTAGTYIYGPDGKVIDFYIGATPRWRIQSNGDLTPWDNHGVSLGSPKHSVQNGYFNGTVSAAKFQGPLTGNASTATALAAAPVACNRGRFATGIAANGDAVCATPAASAPVTSVNGQSGAVSLAVANLSDGGTVIRTTGAQAITGVKSFSTGISLGAAATVTTPSGLTGVNGTLSCPAGQSIKSITVSAGLVTAVNCGQ